MPLRLTCVVSSNPAIVRSRRSTSPRPDSESCGEARWERAELEQVVGALPLVVVPFTQGHVWRAAELRSRHHDRRDSAVSLADCGLVAGATAADRVATADPAVLRMARAEGVATLELPRP